MNRSKYKFITRLVWTRKGVEAFEKEINDAIHDGWEPHGIEFSKGLLRILCLAMLEQPPDKCECECPCCIEMHQGACGCECDCCLAHKHREGLYPVHEEDD